MTSPVYFTVEADFKAFIEDASTDSDYDPQVVPISATVTFTPLINAGDVVLATGASPRPTGFIPAPITAIIDPVDGRLKMRTGTDVGATGFTFAPVRLLGSSPLLELAGALEYSVRFSEVVFSNGRRGSIAGFNFEAPNSDTVLNLITVARQPGQIPGGITKIAPGAVRLNDNGELVFSFSGVDIPDPVDLDVVSDYDFRLDDNRTPIDGSVSLAKLDSEIATGVAGLSSPYFTTSTTGVVNANTDTNATTKATQYGVAHYTNTEEPLFGLQAESTSSTSAVRIGGGSSSGNAATRIELYTAANTTTTTGTRQCLITSDGGVLYFNDVKVGADTDGQRLLYLNAASGQFRSLQFQSAGVGRWNIRASDTAESGGDTGSNLEIQSRTDAGSAKTVVVTIARDTGVITLGGLLSAIASTTAFASLRLPHGSAPTSPTNGDVWTTTSGLFIRINGATVQPEIIANKGVANGYAPLDASAKIDSSFLPSYVDDVLSFSAESAFPVSGETGKIYVANDTGDAFRWTGSSYLRISDRVTAAGITDSTTVGRAVVTAASELAGRTAIGLSNADNTADASKNVLSATKLTTARTVDGVSFDGTANVTVIAPGTNAATAKTAPADTDVLPLVDTEASNVLKKLSWSSIKTALKGYYDSVASTLSNKSVALGSNTVTGTTSEFNAALTDNDFATLAGSETLTNKVLTAPSISSPTGLVKGDVGLGNVDNTSDLNKPVSTATQTALDAKEPTVSAGTSGQYYRGDKTFQTLNTTAVTEGTNLYFTNARADGRISAAVGVTVQAYDATNAVTVDTERVDDLASGESTMSRRFVSANAVASGSQSLRLTYFTARKTETISQVRVPTGVTAASGATLCRIGIYEEDPSTRDLTLVASTANDTALWIATSTVYTKSLSASFTKTRGKRYAVGLLFVGSTAPNFTGQTGVAGGEAGQTPRTGGLVGSQSDLPSSVSSGSINGQSHHAYVALVP